MKSFERMLIVGVLLLHGTPFVVANDPTPASSPSRLFRHQYHKADLSFCNSSVCVDFDGDGRRELLFASRKTKQLQMLRAADGTVVWSKKLTGEQQSISAYDLDSDGEFDILYTVSGPGRLYVLDRFGGVHRQWDSGDWKLGNSAVVLDSDGDGQLEGFFGSRSKYLIRLNMADLSLVQRRGDWVQCGCYTSAMDVDRDGRWDLFAGSGDDSNGKGVLHRYDPLTLKTVWSFDTNDNASSADAVLVDIDRDGQMEIIKSVDNYGGDDAHDAVYAFETDGTLLWKTAGLAGEDSPNAADLDGDGEVEIVGMTFGCEVYCLDAKGRIKWKKDLRAELDDAEAHAYLAPILCDVNGDRCLEILALTNGGYFDATGKPARGRTPAAGVVFALSATGEILDRFAVGGHRYWGDAFVCNVDDDPFLELVVSGSGGLDVIETKGYGPNFEHFQRRRNYQRLNVVPWAYEDSYFIYRGKKDSVMNLTDNLVLDKTDGRYVKSGKFTTELLSLPPDGFFDQLQYQGRTPEGTALTVNILDRSGRRIKTDVPSHRELNLTEPVRLEFVFSTSDGSVTPTLDSYSLTFGRRLPGADNEQSAIDR
jgi:outer membrane protein assembly factor BamB